MKNGKAIIFSAPSGSGKTTIVHQLLDTFPQLAFSISACTRQPRSDEKHGRDYYFLQPEEFQRKIQENAFIEWEQVYTDVYYGTLKSEVERLWNEGRHVIFDVDVVGGVNLKNWFQEQALAIYVKVPSLETLEARLKARNTDSPEKIAERIKKARYEMTFENRFDVTLVNTNLTDSIIQARNLVEEFLSTS